MSIQIKTVNLVEKIAITDRDVNLFDYANNTSEHIQSVNIYQTDGSFITTKPFENKLTWYPQAPYNVENTQLGMWKDFSTFSKYGNLFYPTDARFDFTRRKLWIADSGNNRVLRVDIDSGSVLTEIKNGYFSNSITIDINSGNIYVKSIKDKNTGIIQNYDVNGALLNTFEFVCNYGIDGNNKMNTYDFIKLAPLPSSMVFDNFRKRLWWVGDEYVYMADTLTKNIVPNKISDYRFNDARGIDIDIASGNAFVTVGIEGSSNYYILQIFRDNNQIVSVAYREKIFVPTTTTTTTLIPTTTTTTTTTPVPISPDDICDYQDDDMTINRYGLYKIFDVSSHTASQDLVLSSAAEFNANPSQYQILADGNLIYDSGCLYHTHQYSTSVVPQGTTLVTVIVMPNCKLSGPENNYWFINIKCVATTSTTTQIDETSILCNFVGQGGYAGLDRTFYVYPHTTSKGFILQSVHEFSSGYGKGQVIISADGVVLYNSGCTTGRTNHSVSIPRFTSTIRVVVIPSCTVLQYRNKNITWYLKFGCIM